MNWKNQNWYNIGLIFTVLLLVFVTPVFAYSGSLTGTGFLNVTTHTCPPTGAAFGVENIQRIYFPAIQNYPDLIYVYSSTAWTDFAWDGTSAGSVPVEFWIGTDKVGDGTFSFVNNSALGTMQIMVTAGGVYGGTWDVSGYSGAKTVNMTSTDSNWAVHGLHDLQTQAGGTFGGNIGLGPTFHRNYVIPSSDGVRGSYTVYRQYSFRNDWTLTQTSGLITATVTKTILGKTYQSKAAIYQTDNSLISGEAAVGIADYSTYTVIAPVKIAIIDPFNIWYNTSYYFGGASYSISVNPILVTPTQSVTGTLSPALGLTLDPITEIVWEYQDEGGYHNLYENNNASRLMHYAKQGSFWYGYDLSTYTYANNKSTTMPNPVTFTVPTSGSKTITCNIKDTSGNIYELQAALTVSSGYTTTRAVAIDWQSGNRIRGAQISFWDSTNASWTNTTTTSANNDEATIVTSAGHIFNIYATAANYTSASLLNVPAKSTGIYTLFMYPVGGVLAAGGNTTLYVTALDSITYVGISSASVTVARTSDQVSQFSYTASSGTATFFVPNNTEYFVNVQKAGYQGVTEKITIAAEPMFSHTVMLTKTVATIEPTTALPTLPSGVIHYTQQTAVAASWDILIQALTSLVGMGAVAIWFTLFWIMVAAMTGHIPGIGGKLFGGGGRSRKRR